MLYHGEFEGHQEWVIYSPGCSSEQYKQECISYGFEYKFIDYRLNMYFNYGKCQLDLSCRVDDWWLGFNEVGKAFMCTDYGVKKRIEYGDLKLEDVREVE